MSEQNIHHTFSFQKSWIKFLVLSFFLQPLCSDSWAEDTLKKLSLKERIAQLIMVPVCTAGKGKNVDESLKFLETFPCGGVIFMQGSISSQQETYKRLQEKSPLPLLIGQDNEWGLELRLKDALRFPRNLALGAIQDKTLLDQFGEELALQCKGVGVHVNFAPVVDVNNNPLNPVIADRSFGEDPEHVADCANHVMKGLHKGGVIACPKHFPGHGDTHIDSHLALPAIQKSKEDLQSVEWLPYKKLIHEGLDAVMSAHISFPLIAGDLPSSLSEEMITGCLRDELGFEGLVFTDSLFMKAITEHFEMGSADLLALRAGTDVILMPKDPEKTLSTIAIAVESGEISIEEINEKVLKVLKLKEKLGLHKSCSLSSEINFFSSKAKKLKADLFASALTLVKKSKTLPLPREKIAFVQIGRDVAMKEALEITKAPTCEQVPKDEPPFFKELSIERDVDYYFLPKNASSHEVQELLSSLKHYSTIVVGIYEMNKFESKNFGLCDSTFEFLEGIEDKSVYLSLFGSPYALKYFESQHVILMAYENDEDAQKAASEVFLGKRKPLGRLPITASSKYPRGHGL